MKASTTRSSDWSRHDQSYDSVGRKPSLVCFNARLDFLNNLSDGIVKKLPKQRKTSHARELDMPLPPGCFPEKVSFALRQSSSNLLKAPSPCNNNTVSTKMESSNSAPLLAAEEGNVDIENRVDSWYVRLSQTPDLEQASPKPQFNKVFSSSPKLAHNKQLQAFKRQTQLGSSLKLQNGSYPDKYKKKSEDEMDEQEKDIIKVDEENFKNENNAQKENTKNPSINVIDDKENVSLADSSFSRSSSSQNDTLSSELFDPLSDKVDDDDDTYLRRSSSVLSKTPSIRSEQYSVFSADSTYGTSEFSNGFRRGGGGSAKIKQDVAYDFDRLSKVLDHIDGDILKEHLKACLTSKNPKFVKSLSTLLPRNKFKGQLTHCVRCHSEYDKHHGNTKCVLRHPTEDVILISEDGKSALFQCERCSCVFKLDGTLEYNEHKVDISNCGTCFTGQHTNHASEVEYEPEGFAKSCTDQKCAIFFV